jgi:hypothetical protein
METILQRYERVKNEPRDISEHLETLYNYALECDSIVELGVNEGISTTAFCLALGHQRNQNKKFTNVDVHITSMFQDLINMCYNEDIQMNFILANDLDIEIPECDLLFIDTLHCYAQLVEELKLHGNRAKKYIICHDTETFGQVGIDGSIPGLQQAINEFIVDNPQWDIKIKYPNCNGLTILERK